MLHAEVIQKNIDVLLRCTTINLYVIDFLRAKDVIDDAQESDLKAEGSHQKQLILLFQWLKVVSSDRYESFLQVMKDAEQEHVANLFTGSNEGNVCNADCILNLAPTSSISQTSHTFPPIFKLLLSLCSVL